jgi:Flp pilus assembly protein TadD
MKQKQYEQAIALGESLAAEQLKPDVRINLAASYYFSGRKDKAKSLFEEVVGLPDLPDVFAKVANDWLARLKAESDTTERRPPTSSKLE